MDAKSFIEEIQAGGVDLDHEDKFAILLVFGIAESIENAVYVTTVTAANGTPEERRASIEAWNDVAKTLLRFTIQSR